MIPMLLVAMLFPTHTGLVTDPARMLTVAQETTLEHQLVEYNRKTGVEFAVVVVHDLGGEEIEPYANALFHEWGIGNKAADNGVLLLWAVTERKVRIEVGYGLEQKLPDGRAGQIIRENILPRFRAQDWIGGIQGGVNAVIMQLDRTPAVPIAASSGDGFNVWWFSFVFGLAVGVIAFIVLRFKKKESPKIKYAHTRDHLPPIIVAPIISDYSHHEKKHSSYTSGETKRHSYDDDPSSSPSSSSDSSGGGFGGFGGGDSGGGGASGSY